MTQLVFEPFLNTQNDTQQRPHEKHAPDDRRITLCGLAAFSIPSGVKRNARALAHSLLTQIESRGSHASGFAYVGADNSLGVYKSPIPGSQLPLHELPRNAKAVILHTRCLS